MIKLYGCEDKILQYMITLNLYSTINQVCPSPSTSEENAVRFMKKAPHVITKHGITKENVDLIDYRLLDLVCRIKEPVYEHGLDSFDEFLLKEIMLISIKKIDAVNRILAITADSKAWKSVLELYFQEDLQDTEEGQWAKDIVDKALNLENLIYGPSGGSIIFANKEPITCFDAYKDEVPDIRDDVYDLNHNFIETQVTSFKRKKNPTRKKSAAGRKPAKIEKTQKGSKLAR